MWWRWVVACAVGEALGIAVVGTAYAAIDRGLLSTAPGWIIFAGAWEGFCLGGAQAIVLRQLGASPLYWIVLTVAAAVIGYTLSLAGGAGGADSNAAEPSALMLALLGAGFGVVMGLLMGAIQWLAAPVAFPFWLWLVANAIGWGPAMAVIMIAATSADRTWPLYAITAMGAASGAIAGLSVGVATWLVVRKTAARLAS